MWKKAAAIVGRTIVFLVLASPARADAILNLGNVPQAGDENVLLNSGAIGNPLFGETNQTSLIVQLWSNETLIAPSNGQARVEALDGSLTYLDVSIPGGSFTSLIFNLDASANGTIDFSATDINGGVFAFPNIDLGGSGSNFFTFVATGGLPLAHVSLTTDAPVVLTDAGHFRVGGAELGEALQPTAVPEPISLVLLGSGLIGVAARSRWSRKVR